ncbi:MAG: hypothetical protein M5R36_18145 [Deltaproteobacteria bacterium]|nr:hypothetical protein [Deltaproteobacteria bacterium]
MGSMRRRVRSGVVEGGELHRVEGIAGHVAAVLDDEPVFYLVVEGPIGFVEEAAPAFAQIAIENRNLGDALVVGLGERRVVDRPAELKLRKVVLRVFVRLDRHGVFGKMV